MRIIRISNILRRGSTFVGNGLGYWGILWRFLFSLFLILSFILLFCLRGCTNNHGVKLGPEREMITQSGDTLRGQNPQLMNPENQRSADRKGATPGGYRPDDSRNIGWPKGVGGDRNPALPPQNSNRMSPVAPQDRISDPDTGKDLDGAHLFVILDSDAGDETFNSFASGLSAAYEPSLCSVEYYNTLSKTILLRVVPASRETIKSELPSKIPDVSFYVVDVELLSPEFQPNDPAFSDADCSWQYAPVQDYDAWDINCGDPNVTVAIIDSYFDMYHPDLEHARVVHPYSVERCSNNVLPDISVLNEDAGTFLHGTHVAGIVFAQINNQEGIAGIAPKCSFMPVSLGHVLTDYAQIEGILYAIYKGASVINLSIGAYFNQKFASHASLRDQVEIAENEDKEKEKLWDYVFRLCEERNVTIVWASGNQNVLSAMDVSKRNSGTVRVDAVDRSLRKADYSNWGILPEYRLDNSTISAPGSGIVSTIPGGDYLSLDGTSMAAPMVTGAVALMKSMNINLKNSEVIEILKGTSKPVKDRNISGLLQIHDALLKVRENFLRFDDVMNNHDALIGKWEATTTFSVTQNDVETGETVKLEMDFSTSTRGVVALSYVTGERSGVVCSAPIMVSWGTDKLTMHDTKCPSDGVGNVFTQSTYHCASDDGGLLRVSCIQGVNPTPVNFYLKKK